MPGQEYGKGQDKKELKVVVGITLFCTALCCLLTEGVPFMNKALDTLNNPGAKHSSNWNNQQPKSNYGLGTPQRTSPSNSGSGSAEPADGGAWNDACDNTLQNLLNPDCHSSWPP